MVGPTDPKHIFIYMHRYLRGVESEAVYSRSPNGGAMGHCGARSDGAEHRYRGAVWGRLTAPPHLGNDYTHTHNYGQTKSSIPDAFEVESTEPSVESRQRLWKGPAPPTRRRCRFRLPQLGAKPGTLTLKGRERSMARARAFAQKELIQPQAMATCRFSGIVKQ